jgi:4-amino-4-deoxychorismate lyase
MDGSGNWFTPETFLLNGTRRSGLLKTGKIKMAPICVNDLRNYSEVKLINAMLGIDDTEGIPVSNII